MASEQNFFSINTYDNEPNNIIYIVSGENRISVPSTYGITVFDFLEKLKLEEYYFGDFNRILQNNDELELSNVYFSIDIEEFTIQHDTIAVFNDTMIHQTRNYIRDGHNGHGIRSNVTFYNNNEIISQTTILEKIIEYPTSAFVHIGTLKNVVETTAGTFRYLHKFTAEATAYSPEQEYLSRYTASGLPLYSGLAAVDTNIIPLGTYIYVVGHGLFLAADTGGAIVGYKVDLAFDTIREALVFGRRNVEVYVLDKVTDLF
ncbi:MAG: 3D domain-containing protein [Defluviitaleaceae bacterium]|nr:3D domain-containing protein [Defluviitaleaceae bacterium]